MHVTLTCVCMCDIDMCLYACDIDMCLYVCDILHVVCVCMYVVLFCRSVMKGFLIMRWMILEMRRTQHTQCLLSGSNCAIELLDMLMALKFLELC